MKTDDDDSPWIKVLAGLVTLAVIPIIFGAIVIEAVWIGHFVLWVIGQ